MFLHLLLYSHNIFVLFGKGTTLFNQKKYSFNIGVTCTSLFSQIYFNFTILTIMAEFDSLVIKFIFISFYWHLDSTQINAFTQ